MSHHFLRFENVRYRYPSGVEALGGVSFCLTHSEKVALVGANGAGKSTLLLHANGLLLPSSGCVNVGGVPVCRRTLPLVRQTVGLVFQNADDQLFMPTVEDDVAFGPTNMRLPPDEVERRVVEALAAVGVPHLRHRACQQLSDGQKRSVAIATVLAMQPNILVMDEPTASLDPLARQQFINLIRTFSHSCLIATHDLDLVRQLCPRTLILKDGTILADGSTPALFADRKLMVEARLATE